MRVSVDQQLCTAHGVCEDIAPEVFEVDDDGMAIVLIDPVDGELRPRVRAAAAQCPARAIVLAAQADA